VSRDTSQLAWHTGHLALFRRYAGVPLWVRIDNLRTGVASGAGPTAVLNRSYRVFARECGFEVDPCRPATGSDKAKAERGVRIFRESFADLLHADWPTIEALQAALDERSVELAQSVAVPGHGDERRGSLPRGATGASWCAAPMQRQSPSTAAYRTSCARWTSPGSRCGRSCR